MQHAGKLHSTPGEQLQQNVQPNNGLLRLSIFRRKNLTGTCLRRQEEACHLLGRQGTNESTHGWAQCPVHTTPPHHTLEDFDALSS